MVTIYKCDRCGKEVKGYSKLRNIQIYKNGYTAYERKHDDLCEDCINVITTVINNFPYPVGDKC
jgi:ribosomal protein L34E